jgi:broad specificity phosphatase PhoE
VGVEFVLVQHGEKARTAGDPGLTPTGVQQAACAAAFLASRHRAGERIDGLRASPARRTRETAAPLAAALGLPVHLDARLRERMNWGDGPAGQALGDFLREWARATGDRDFTPASGESSRAAGARLLAALDDLAATDCGQRLILVTHGGVTVDLLRTLIGDAAVRRQHPALLTQGVPPAAITRLRPRPCGAGYVPTVVASVAHLAAGAGRPPATGVERS